jgi:pimeloyl-ACP methyl ester carboxylesterase
LAQTLPRKDGSVTPIKTYGAQTGCLPTMIISHGFGGSETGNGYLASTVAAQGWRVIVMGHTESGGPVLRAALLSGSPKQAILEATTTPPRHQARFADLDVAFAEATRLCRPPRLVLAGHSMGAMTTMLEAGAIARFGRFGSNRFDAYIAISPQGIGYTYAQGAWASVSKPVLMITGTRDQGSDGGIETRLSAFEGLPSGRKRLAIIPGAGHLQLSANSGNAVGKAVADLAIEFLAATAAPGRLAPSALKNFDIRDK